MVGCGTTSSRPGKVEAWSGGETLTTIVSELRINLREDPYRYPRPVMRDGRGIFPVLLWKLDRLKRQRERKDGNWENVDHVIEFARARIFERMRRYAEAEQAYSRVAQSGSVLADLAVDDATAMVAFARLGRPLERSTGSETKPIGIETRIDDWRSLAAHYRGNPRSALAWEEVEDWQTLRVDWFARRGETALAILACRRLIEHNPDSKRHAQHLIRLGDLYADSAMRSRLHKRPSSGLERAQEYEKLLDKAFAAYELAVDDRSPGLRREAETRIEALIAFHEGSKTHAP